MPGPILKEDDPLYGAVDLEWVRSQLKSISPEQYLARYNCPGLLLSLKASNAEKLSAGKISSGDTFRGIQSKEELDRYGLVLVTKRPRNTRLPLMITVGRSETVDIPLNFPTISKLHAFFYKVQSNWVLVDAGSSNGTIVEGKTLQARAPHTLKDGHSIEFGYDVSCKFMHPKNLVSFLFE